MIDAMCITTTTRKWFFDVTLDNVLDSRPENDMMRRNVTNGPNLILEGNNFVLNGTERQSVKSSIQKNHI